MHTLPNPVPLVLQVLRLERIPEPGETEPLETFHIGGGEFGDALGDERERGAGVVETAESEVGGPGFFPERVVQGTAFGGKAKESSAMERCACSLSCASVSPFQPSRRGVGGCQSLRGSGA